MEYLNKIIQADVIDGLKMLPDESVHCIVTSPPYFGLRDYKVDGQMGLEDTVHKFIIKLVGVFREAWRVLRDDGTCWVNLGDTYAAYYGQKYGQSLSGSRENRGQAPPAKKSPTFSKSKRMDRGEGRWGVAPTPANGGVKPKDLFLVPFEFALAMRADGWYMRDVIIWHKPNPMPESVSDRCTKSHEYIFMFSKQPRYYYDALAIATPLSDKTYTTYGNSVRTGYGDGTGLVASENWHRDVPERKPKDWKTPDGWDTGKGSHGSFHKNGREKGKKTSSGNLERVPRSERGAPEGSASNLAGNVPWEGNKANKRSVWTIATKRYSEAHFATFPPELPIDCIKAGTSEYGCCPTCGTPYIRQTQPSERYEKVLGEGYHDHSADASEGMAQTRGSNKQNKMRDAGIPAAEYVTTGWKQSCKCPDDKTPIPCLVLDPFMGAATTAVVAAKLGRDYVGIELNPEYIKIAEKRLADELGLFKP